MKTLAAVGLAIALAGCATGYHPQGFSGGYSELQLNADTFKIIVSGNGYTSKERAQNIAVLRACELTLEHGGERFVLLAGNVSHQYAGTTDLTATRIGNTLIFGGGDAIFKPGGEIVIRIVRLGDPAYPSAFDAKLIADQLRPKFVS